MKIPLLFIYYTANINYSYTRNGNRYLQERDTFVLKRKGKVVQVSLRQINTRDIINSFTKLPLKSIKSNIIMCFGLLSAQIKSPGHYRYQTNSDKSLRGSFPPVDEFNVGNPKWIIFQILSTESDKIKRQIGSTLMKPLRRAAWVMVVEGGGGWEGREMFMFRGNKSCEQVTATALISFTFHLFTFHAQHSVVSKHYKLLLQRTCSLV